MLSYFDHSIEMDFLKYKDRKEPLSEKLIQTLVDAYNATPANFQNPPDSTIESVIAAVDKQIARDKKLLADADFFMHYTDGSEEDTATTPSTFNTVSNEEQTPE